MGAILLAPLFSGKKQWQIQRGLLEPPFKANLFHFHGEFSEKSGKNNK